MGARQSVKSGHSLRSGPDFVPLNRGCQAGSERDHLRSMSPRVIVYRGSLFLPDHPVDEYES